MVCLVSYTYLIVITLHLKSPFYIKAPQLINVISIYLHLDRVIGLLLIWHQVPFLHSCIPVSITGCSKVISVGEVFLRNIGLMRVRWHLTGFCALWSRDKLSLQTN